MPRLIVPVLWYAGADFRFPQVVAQLEKADFKVFANIDAPTKKFKDAVRAFAERVLVRRPQIGDSRPAPDGPEVGAVTGFATIWKVVVMSPCVSSSWS